MKKLIYLLFAIVLFSCSPEPPAPNDPANKVFVDKNDYSWEKNPDGPGNVQVFVEKITVEPTWGMAFNYAFKASYTLSLILGIVFFALGLYLLNIRRSREFSIWFIFGAFAISALFLFIQPGNIRWNNNKTFDKAYYEAVHNEEGSTKRLWDSLENNCHIIGGPSKGCK